MDTFIAVRPKFHRQEDPFHALPPLLPLGPIFTIKSPTFCTRRQRPLVVAACGKRPVAVAARGALPVTL